MTTLFERDWSIRVGSLELTRIDVTFSVTRTLKPEPNTAELGIYNLNPDHRSQVESQVSVPVIIEAGYVGAGRSVIFHGDMRNAATEREGADRITRLESGDGERRRQRARISRSFRGGTSVETVLRELASALGVGIGNAVEAFRSATFSTGAAVFRERCVLSGGVAAELEQLCRSCGLEYSIQNGALQVLPRGRPLQGTAIVLNSDSGLIGSPKKERDDRQRPLLTAVCMMIPDVNPGRLVQIQSEDVSGQFRIESTVHKGDTAGSDWTIELTMRGADARAAG